MSRRRWDVLLSTFVAACGLLVACGGEKPTLEDVDRPLAQMRLVAVEGDVRDQWEIWEDTATGARVLCHHSGWSGASGGRSTSCVVVGKQ